jgi:hypothetical protein
MTLSEWEFESLSVQYLSVSEDFDVLEMSLLTYGNPRSLGSSAASTGHPRQEEEDPQIFSKAVKDIQWVLANKHPVVYAVALSGRRDVRVNCNINQP